MRKTIILISLFLFLSLIVSCVKAESFDIMNVPSYLDDQLGCGEFIGGLLASIGVLVITLFPIIVATKGKQATLYILVFFAVLAPLAGLGWFPIWLYIILVLVIAFSFGQKLADFIGGLKK